MSYTITVRAMRGEQSATVQRHSMTSDPETVAEGTATVFRYGEPTVHLIDGYAPMDDWHTVNTDQGEVWMCTAAKQ